MFFTTKSKFAGGITIRRFGHEYHLFTTLDSHGSDISKRTVYHAVSHNLQNWTEYSRVIDIQKKHNFEAYTLYDVDAYQKGDKYYFFYTGINQPGIGQKQAIGVAISSDKRNWIRYENNPILEADVDEYESVIPKTSCYQEKDEGRQWFRDPWITWDETSKQYFMAVGARSAKLDPDINGCIAWASSKDLLNWKSLPPLFAPGRFHTIEVPVIIEKDGLHYLFYLTHPRWGYPIISTDPYQRFGNYFAYSKNGLQGPYQTPEDEIVLCSNCSGELYTRIFPLRVVDDENGDYWAYYHLLTFVDQHDQGPKPKGISYTMPLPKKIRFLGDGNIELMCNDKIFQGSQRVELPSTPNFLENGDTRFWKKKGNTIHGKSFKNINEALFNVRIEHLSIQADIQFIHGLKAGFIFRSKDKNDGLKVTLNRNLQRVELGTTEESKYIEARKWVPKGDTFELKVIAVGPSIEIYVNDKLMIHQIRYREKEGNFGIFIDEAEAVIKNLKVSELVNTFPK